MTFEPASVDAVLAYLLADVAQLPPVRVSLADALGLSLAEPVFTRHPLPSFTNSAMDGYAVRIAETRLATPARPVQLPVAGVVPAGAGRQSLTPGTCARIMTGAPLPIGADAVIPFELVSEGWDASDPDREAIALSRPATAGQNVRYAGSDLPKHYQIGDRGDRIEPGRIGLFAASGHDIVLVTPRPRVAIVSTGYELRETANSPDIGQIPDVNGPMLAAATIAAGGVPMPSLLPSDDPAALLTHLAHLPDADLVMTTGGVSAGDFDPLRNALATESSVRFWHVAMKPGRPLAYGRFDRKPLLGLPGNPVAAMISFLVFARPLIAKLAGGHPSPVLIPVRIAERLANPGGRRFYSRVRLDPAPDGVPLAWPDPDQQVSRLARLAAADALLIVPEAIAVAEPGAIFSALPLKDDPSWLASVLRADGGTTTQ